jgi:hypothetical protein
MATDQTYTVGEMAARIARSESDEEVAAITRQLRNWTVLGLISPQGETHQGTGMTLQSFLRRQSSRS